MISRTINAMRVKFSWHAFNRRKIYRRVFESDDGKFILADLMRGSGVLDVDNSPTMEESNRIVSRWWPVANILNGMAMTDKQIVEWATDAARTRADELYGEQIDD